MSILKILTAPNTLLKEISKPIDKIDDEIRSFMKDMLETMYHDKGIGLAAPQVGILKRIIVLDLKDEDFEASKLYPLYMANPEIIWKSEEMVIAEEGCLSLPEQIIEVARSESIEVKYLDYDGDTRELKADGWLARAIQHEIDHLNGKLLIDYLSILKKDVALRKLKKLKSGCLK
jgi:peptide deformylase